MIDGINVFNQVNLNEIKKPGNQPETSWVNQSVSPGTTEKFQLLLNGPSESNMASAAPGANAPQGTTTNKWDDIFHREQLMQAVQALETAKVQEIPAAAARVTLISLDMQMKVDAVRQGSKNSEEAIQSMLRT
ncbi:MAG: hypothetical protein ABW044_08425 [Cellvibrio sp.]